MQFYHLLECTHNFSHYVEAQVTHPEARTELTVHVYEHQTLWEITEASVDNCKSLKVNIILLTTFMTSLY